MILRSLLSIERLLGACSCSNSLLEDEILLMSLPTIHLVAVVAENLFSPNQSQLFQL